MDYDFRLWYFRSGGGTLENQQNSSGQKIISFTPGVKAMLLTLGFIAVIGTVGLFGVARYTMDEFDRSRDEFEASISRAKSYTRSPCTQFFVLLHPPKNMGNSVLVMFGEKFYSLNPLQQKFFLKPVGDKVELWEHQTGNGSTLAPIKIGEKYYPDSKFCQDYGK